MRIYIDASRAIRPNPTGIEVYSREITQALLYLPEAVNHEWILLHPTTTVPPSESIDLPEYARWEHIPGKRFWTLARLSHYFQTRTAEEACLFVPGHVLPYFTPKRSVVTLHDFAFRYFPSLYGLTGSLTMDRELQRSARKANQIIVPSLSAAKDLRKFYNIHENKIHVIPHGINHEFYKKYLSKNIKPYFVSISRLEGRKNIERIVRSFLEFAKTDTRGSNLYLVGKAMPEWHKFWKSVERSVHTDRIHVLGYLGEDDKLKLLAEATALFYPSLYEGFGFPLLEAMTLGTPIITSRASSMAEIAQDAALYVDPTSISDMVKALTIMASDPNQAERMGERGQKISQEFSWERAAKATLGVLTQNP